MTSEKSIFDGLIRLHDKKALKKMSELETQTINGLENARDQNSSYNKEEVFIADFSDFALTHVVPLIDDACSKFKIVPKDLYDDLDNQEKVEKFFLSIPFVDISLRLLHDLYRQKDKSLNRNDLRDIAFLTTAIPYSDIIVTEKFWAHTIRKLKLDEKYKTKIFTNIDEAALYLSE